MSRPLITMTLIAKDEADNVEPCFSSWWESVDQVVLVDTGSRDGTTARARSFAASRNEPSKLIVTKFKWVDDFAAARQAADDLADGEWLIWCDLDDQIEGLDRLRTLVENATADTVAFMVRYNYARDDQGNTVTELWRERVVRNDGTRWQDPLHEHKIFKQGTLVQVDPSVCEYIHHRDHSQRTGERNLRILEAWRKREPEDPRVLSSLAMEYMGECRWKDASDTYEQFLALPDATLDAPDRRWQGIRHLCQALLVQNRVDEAREWALRALAENWLWADTHLTLAEAEQTLGRPDVGFVHAKTALEIGKPNTVLIVNPLHYTAQPHTLMGLCLAQMGRFEDAVREGEKALELSPAFPLAVAQMPLWRAGLQKQHAVGAFINCARVLAETGELFKARMVLDAVPWYVADNPELIRQRVEVDRLTRERLACPASLPADEAAEAFIKQHQQEPVAA